MPVVVAAAVATAGNFLVHKTKKLWRNKSVAREFFA
jgi:hypothetical protein